jgi:hypothetical protein
MSMTAKSATYTDLEKWIDGFLNADGLPLLFLVGNPGTGKSAAFSAKLDADRHHCIKAAKLTTFQFYKQLYRVRNKAIILDDIDDALRRSDMARLLMALCESDGKPHTLAWFGTETLLKIKDGKMDVPVPREFETTSRVCVIGNDWNILTIKFRALLDRGTVVFFHPGAEEMHRFARKWFKDKEIYNFIGQHLADIAQHSFRFYTTAADQKRQNLDWKAVLQESWTNDRSRGNATEKLVERLLADTTFKTDKERIEAFAAHLDGGSRRTWYYLKKNLVRNGPL